MLIIIAIFYHHPPAPVPKGQIYPVLIKGKYGFMDKNGKLVIPPKFDFVLSPLGQKDFWTVEIDTWFGFGRKSYFMDNTGRILPTQSFNEVTYFSEGLASVENGNKWGFIDRTGKLVIQPQFEFVGYFLKDWQQPKLLINGDILIQTGNDCYSSSV